MNLLILGGALVIAVLAIVGVVWAVRGESATTPNVQSASIPTAPTARTPTALPSIGKSSSATQTRALEPPPVTETLPVAKEDAWSARSEEKPFPISNGQLHELASQLQTLHQQAQELERRLSVLTNMIEHIERSQNGRLSIEDEEELGTTEVPPRR